MNSTEAKLNQVFDEEWVALMHAAREIGLTLEEVREFIHQNKVEIK
ncbi:anti-repressor SinI family protein [Jeotgalibacillus soli]|uniref:Sin domain-containing protein n=1 Tax=Jeotgalibacillus soli TaxID=889306 RepID=A0A0C2VMC3_9BACL|nr:anti-repressor SinI family protein [Jeotgalibacillus soli]KIL50032.1 hypothetical protein KP78_15000 [Jeotgalibacillus soli]